jgi:hypothetical protein
LMSMTLWCNKLILFYVIIRALCDDVHLCNRCVREFWSWHVHGSHSVYLPKPGVTLCVLSRSFLFSSPSSRVVHAKLLAVDIESVTCARDTMKCCVCLCPRHRIHLTATLLYSSCRCSASPFSVRAIKFTWTRSRRRSACRQEIPRIGRRRS